MEDKEVEEGDWRGLSKGDAETELTAEDSVGRLRFSATRLGTAVDDMLESKVTVDWYKSHDICDSRQFSSLGDRILSTHY
jgi:hypothetical protein